MRSSAAAAALVAAATVSAHGNITSPPARLPGPGMAAACGSQAVAAVEADGTIPLEDVTGTTSSCTNGNPRGLATTPPPCPYLLTRRTHRQAGPMPWRRLLRQQSARADLLGRPGHPHEGDSAHPARGPYERVHRADVDQHSAREASHLLQLVCRREAARTAGQQHGFQRHHAESIPRAVHQGW